MDETEIMLHQIEKIKDQFKEFVLGTALFFEILKEFNQYYESGSEEEVDPRNLLAIQRLKENAEKTDC